MSDLYDTAIIGGGLAGITAARELSQAGQKVALIEAKDRLGGRAWSSDLDGQPVELGGGYVHWSQPHVWSEITRYGLSLIERPYYTTTNTMQRTLFLENGQLRDAFTSTEAEEIKTAFTEFLSPAKEVFPQPYQPVSNELTAKYDNLSNEDRINQMSLSDLARATLLRTTAMQCNNAPRFGGYIEAMRWYALAHCNDETYAASVSRFTLAEGSQGLIDGMMSDTTADVFLSCPVSNVDHTEDTVKIETAKGLIEARHCVMATGVNLWKTVAFSPPLSRPKQQLSQEELSGKGGKIYLKLKGRFRDSRWSAVGSAFLAVLPHIVGDDTSIVVAFTNPECLMSEITRDALQAEVAKFDDSYELIDFVYHDWVADPHVMGTWGNFRPGQYSKYFKDALMSEGALHFATADIAQGWRGFFDGAIESGLRAARAVMTKSPQATD